MENKSLKEQELETRVKSLEERLETAERQLSTCLRYMEREANRQLNERLDAMVGQTIPDGLAN